MMSMLVSPMPPKMSPGRRPINSMENIEQTTPASRMMLTINPRSDDMVDWDSQHGQGTIEGVGQSCDLEKVGRVSEDDLYRQPIYI